MAFTVASIVASDMASYLASSVASGMAFNVIPNKSCRVPLGSFNRACFHIAPDAIFSLVNGFAKIFVYCFLMLI